MGFFEDTLSRAGRVADDAWDRISGGPNSGVRSRIDDLRSWTLDRADRADDALARRGVHVSTLKIASASAMVLLATTIAWSAVHTVRRVTCPPKPPALTSVEEGRAAALTETIVQQKRAAAKAAADAQAAKAARQRQRQPARRWP